MQVQRASWVSFHRGLVLLNGPKSLQIREIKSASEWAWILAFDSVTNLLPRLINILLLSVKMFSPKYCTGSNDREVTALSNLIFFIEGDYNIYLKFWCQILA